MVFAMAPGAVAQTAAEDRSGSPSTKSASPTSLPPRCDGVGRRKTPAEVHVTAAAIVAGVEHIHLLAQNVGAHFHHVAAASQVRLSA